MYEIEQMIQDAIAEVEAAGHQQALAEVKVKYLGKRGEVTYLLGQVGGLPAEQRPAAGQAINQAKAEIAAAIEDRETVLLAAQLQHRLADEQVDMSLPARGQRRGGLHPVSLVLAEIERLFTEIGFSVVDGPEIEDNYYNFEALNIPAHHPARAMHDTFYIDAELLLRTHTSNVQIRYMQAHQPPIRIIAPGRVYRCDSDMTHTPMFHQVEGLMVDTGITFTHLKGILEAFVHNLFHPAIKVRFRPSYFPFTEPSAEVDILGERGWMEILGCGMVHPKVLENVGIDSKKYSGFAFGMGAERMAMLKYGIDDIRLFFDNDLRFLEQFN